MDENGQLAQMWSKWKPRSHKECFVVTETSGIEFGTVKFVFVLLGCCMGMSMVIMLIEKVNKSLKRRDPAQPEIVEKKLKNM